MMAAAERRLWSAAAGVSAALHIALAFGLLVIPVPQPATTAATNIVMLSSQTRTAPTVAAASAGQAQATSVAPQAAEARVDRTAVAAVSAPLAAAGAGIELTPASRTTPDSAGLARRETADAARARTDHRPVDPASGLEVVAAQRQDPPIRPVASFQRAGPRQSPEAARPPAASAAEQVTAHTSSTQRAEGGGAITQSSVSRPARPVDPASGFEVVAAQRQDAPIRPVASFQTVGPRQSPEAARPPAASAAEQVTAHTSSAQPAEGGDAITQSSVSRPVRPVAEAGNVIAPALTPARPTAEDTSRPSAPLQAIPSSPVEAVGRDSPAVQAPAARAAPAETGERVAAIMRPIAPTAARSHEDVENAYLDLLSTLRASRGESCVLALARLVGQSARVDRFVVAAADAVELDQRLRGDAVITIDHRRHAVTDAQCAALDFAASLPSYPEPGLSIELRSAEIASGAVLSGRMSNLQRSWAYLLIVDDEGYVHQLHDLEMEEGALRFRAPLTLTEGPVATVQLLLALTSDSLLTSIRRNDGQEAGAYFEALKDDIEHSGGGVDFGMVPFLVR